MDGVVASSSPAFSPSPFDSGSSLLEGKLADLDELVAPSIPSHTEDESQVVSDSSDLVSFQQDGILSRGGKRALPTTSAPAKASIWEMQFFIP